MKLIRNSYYFLMEEDSLSSKHSKVSDTDVLIPSYEVDDDEEYMVKTGASSHIDKINWKMRLLNKKSGVVFMSLVGPTTRIDISNFMNGDEHE